MSDAMDISRRRLLATGGKTALSCDAVRVHRFESDGSALQ